MTAIILLLVGFTVTYASVGALWRAVKLYLVGKSASGTLVNWRHTYHHRWLGNGRILRSSYFHPVVRFQAPDGSLHEVVSELAFDERPAWPIGRPFQVRYDGENPKDATVDPLAPTWIFSVFFLVAGILILWAAVWSLLSAF
jgi:hypothetical protein